MTRLDPTARQQSRLKSPKYGGRRDLLPWLVWVAATCAGVVTLTLLLSAGRSLPERLDFLRVILVMLQLPGLLALSGAAQQLALRFILPREKGWFRHTLLGALAGMPVGLLLAFLAGYGLVLADRIRYAHVYGRPPANQGAPFGGMSIALLAGILLLTVLAQMRLLRRHSRRAGWWLAFGLPGWAMGLLAAGNLMFPRAGFLAALPYYIFGQASFQAEGPGEAVSMAAGVVLGLLAGAITGAGLIFILRALGTPDHQQSLVNEAQPARLSGPRL